MGALSRPPAMGIRPIRFKIWVHAGRDGGVRVSGAKMARTGKGQFDHALVIFDYEGCGDQAPVNEIERNIDSQLECDWEGNARAVVIAPEVDIWMWGNDNALGEVLRWQEGNSVREWLCERNWQFDANGKPLRPKEALEALRKHQREPRSSRFYEEIALKLSLRRCSDPAFIRLRDLLRAWFPAE